MIRYLIIVIIFTVSTSYSQITFNEHVIIDFTIHPANPNSVVAADLNGDGFNDIIYASRFSNKIAWFINIDGSGEYSKELLISNQALNAQAVFAADIDNDMDIDIISASRDDNKIAWYENLDGKGTFSNQKIISTNAIGARSIYCIDIDNDGDIDVASASHTADKIAWYENLDGNGNFGVEKILTTSADGALFVFAADIDNDNDIDILSASYRDDTIAWFENLDGAGTFSTKKIISDSANGVRSIYVADLDGDQNLDIMAANYLDDRFDWYKNIDGQGNFSGANNLTSEIREPSYIISVDLDNDGDMDVLSASDNISDKSFAYYENLDGAGNFSVPIRLANLSYPTSLFSADLNNDGFIDILASDNGNDKIVSYKNLEGTIPIDSENIISSNSSQARVAIAADIDNDFDIDVLSRHGASYHTVALYENIDGSGEFDKQKWIEGPLNNGSNLDMVDIDYDDDIDLVLYKDNRTWWYENKIDEGKFFVPRFVGSDNGYVTSISIADVDTDGFVDLIVAKESVSKLGWYRNDGKGNFGDYQLLPTNDNRTKNVYSDDMDSDGDSDIVTVSSLDSTISWLENTDGLGNFSERKVIATDQPQTDALDIFDVNGDGLKDIISASYFHDRIVWFENLGDGSFSSQNIIYDTAELTQSMTHADIDQDGDNDLFVGIAGNDFVGWFENTDGLGTFGPIHIIEENHINPQSVFAKDMDFDEDIDLVVAFNDGTISWYENLNLTSNKLRGTVRYDIKDNLCASGGAPVDRLRIDLNNDGNVTSTFTLPNGFYQFFPDKGEYVVSANQISLPEYLSVSPQSVNKTFETIGETLEVDFCLESNTDVNDLYVSITPLDRLIIGLNTRYVINFHSKGSSIMNGEVVFEYDDSKLKFISVDKGDVVKSSNRLTYEFSDLNAFEYRSFILEFEVVIGENSLNDIIDLKTSILPLDGDYNVDDNIFEYEGTIVGSYDPNDITVLEGSEISIEEKDNYLHYVIRFQNVGNSEAIDVRIENTLDDNLNGDSFILEGYSHPNFVSIKNKRDVVFEFNDINLPDSTYNEPESHGYIAYRIKPKDGIDIGDIIYNEADIYFDFNEPVKTNQVSTEIVSSLSIHEFSKNEVKVIPNPTSNRLTIKSNIPVKIVELYNSMGQFLKRSLHKIEIDMSSISKGLYILKIEMEDGSIGNYKIIKN